MFFNFANTFRGIFAPEYPLPYEEFALLQKLFPIVYELALVFGLYALFSEFWKENKKEIIGVGVFYTIFEIPLFLTLYFRRTQETILIFQLIAGCVLIFLFNTLFHFYLRNAGNSESNIPISRQILEDHFKKSNVTRDHLVFLKFQWFSANLMWFLFSFISIILIIMNVDTPYIGALSLFLTNVIFASLFGLFQNKAMGIKIALLFLMGVIHSMILFFLLGFISNFDRICGFFIGDPHFGESCDILSLIILFFFNVLLSFFNYLVNHHFFVQVITDSPNYQPRLLKIMRGPQKDPNRRGAKLWHKIPVILAISFILSFIWGGLTVMLGMEFPNYPLELIYIAANAIFGNFLLFYANPGRHQDQSKKIVILKVFFFSVFFFGLSMLYYLIRINQLIANVILITVQCTFTFVYLIVTRIKYQKSIMQSTNYPEQVIQKH
ncbi:MAG: hypothetical protein ACTSWW_12360 [Promethearchaeota archaeon]